MAKTSTKKSTSKTTTRATSRQSKRIFSRSSLLAWSLAVNAVAIAVLITATILERAGIFDYALINNSVSIMCSDRFHDTLAKTSDRQGDSDNEKGLKLANIDYACGANGAAAFYNDGFDEYAKSLGLTPDTH